MNTPQPPPVQVGLAVTPELYKWIDQNLGEEDASLIKSLVDQRCEYGLRKYGQILMSKDGRDDVVDAMQEMGDLLQYSFKAKMNGRLPELRDQLAVCLLTLVKILESDS